MEDGEEEDNDEVHPDVLWEDENDGNDYEEKLRNLRKAAGLMASDDGSN